MGEYPKRNLIGKAALEEKSAELSISMERLLAGYVMEQLAVKLSESEWGNRLLLKNPGALGLAGGGKDRSYRLYYVYVKQKGEAFGKSEFSSFLKHTIKWETETNIVWSWRSHMEEERLFVELLAVLDDMRMPIELVVDAVEERFFSYPAGEYTLRLLMENNKTCQVAVYPVHKMFFEDLGEVLAKLELIGDMAAYRRIYEMLGELDLEGREFQKNLEKYCAAHGIAMDEVRFSQMEHYQSYPYMEKKWKAYMKKQRKKMPPWAEVYGRFWSFLAPPWAASLKGVIYLGSWISELGRYLD